MGSGRFAFGLAVVITGCSSDDDVRMCTDELRTAVTVGVSSSQGTEGVRVFSVRSGIDGECEDWPPEPDTFHCFERGGGAYTVRVERAEDTWMQSTTVASDYCHVTEHKTLTFDLDTPPD